MAGNPMGGGQQQALSPARQSALQNNGYAPQQPNQQNIYSQTSGAFGDALAGTRAAYGEAMSAPVATAKASTYNAAQMDPARQLANTSLDPYMNPYTSQVIDQNAADMERARLIQQNQANDAMMNAGAFGGSRHGIANAETNRAFYDRLGAMSGQLRNQGFQNAQQAAFQDIGNEIGVNQFNTGETNSERAANAAMQTQVSQANAAAKNAANQARFGNMLNASGQMAGLADQGMRFSNNIADRQMQEGGLTRGIQQGVFDAGRQQFGNFTNAGNLGLSPLQAFTSGNYGGSSSQTSNPGLLGTIGSGLSIASGLGLF